MLCFALCCSAHVHVIKKFYTDLITYLTRTSELADKMFQQHQLSGSVHQSIVQTRHPYAINKILVEAVLNGDDSVYKCFSMGLNELKQNHLYLLLNVPGI